MTYSIDQLLHGCPCLSDTRVNSVALLLRLCHWPVDLHSPQHKSYQSRSQLYSIASHEHNHSKSEVMDYNSTACSVPSKEHMLSFLLNVFEPYQVQIQVGCVQIMESGLQCWAHVLSCMVGVPAHWNE